TFLPNNVKRTARLRPWSNASLATCFGEGRKEDTETVINALIRHAQKLPHELYRSLTWDRGKEMADHRRFTLATDIKVYLCDPRSLWQWGSNENTNGFTTVRLNVEQTQLVGAKWRFEAK